MQPTLHNTMRNTKNVTNIDNETSDIIVNRDQLIRKLIHLIISDNLHDTISLYLMEFIKMAMEHCEKVSNDGEVKRTLVIDAISNVVDKFVKNDSTNITLKHLIPQLIHSIVDVSKKRWSINVKRKSLCL